MSDTIKVNKKELERLKRAIVNATTLIRYADRKLKEIEKIYKANK